MSVLVQFLYIRLLYQSFGGLHSKILTEAQFVSVFLHRMTSYYPGLEKGSVTLGRLVL